MKEKYPTSPFLWAGFVLVRWCTFTPIVAFIKVLSR
jgi:hypothetical protein